LLRSRPEKKGKKGKTRAIREEEGGKRKKRAYVEKRGSELVSSLRVLKEGEKRCDCPLCHSRRERGRLEKKKRADRVGPVRGEKEGEPKLMLMWPGKRGGES